MKADDPRTGPGHSYLRYQQAGEKALLDKRYEPAKRAFDQAFQRAFREANKNTSTLISILDLRVEAQLRLKDLDAAVKDARTMVRYGRADPRGYLRCGQLGIWQRDLTGAQKWYRRGLRNVPQTHDSYHKLESMSLKTIGKSAERRSNLRDPFLVLPMDLIHMVIDHLEFWEATSCLRVSRTWRNTLLATHSVWKTLDFQGTQDIALLRHLKACIRRLPRPPTTIRLDRLTASAIEYLRPYLRLWRATEHISINLPEFRDLGYIYSASTSLKSLHVGKGCTVYFLIVDDILHSCNMLQNARFDSILGGCSSRDERVHQSTPRVTLPELSHLVLTANNADGNEEDQLIKPPGIFRDFPNLRELHCSGFVFCASDADLSTAQCLLHLSLKNGHLNHDFKLPSSLESLICEGVTGAMPLSTVPDQQPEELETLSNLKVLKMDRARGPLSRSLKMMKGSPATTLTRLDLTGGDMTLATLMTLFELGKLSRLAFLGIRHMELTDENVQRIASGCSMLEQVEFSGLRITGVAVKELCVHTTIKTLKLLDCCDISADAIQWARAMGISVIVKQSRQTSGRRVRCD